MNDLTNRIDPVPTEIDNGYNGMVNGYSNWETWNLILWLGNDEDIYRQLRYMLSKLSPENEAAAKAFIRGLYPNGTPDMTGADEYGRVNWSEVLSFCNEILDDIFRSSRVEPDKKAAELIFRIISQ